ncbi:MAG: alanine:cation symporter family protein [Ruminiclostridium sp.]|nr:alanine:cation symporter family protein [Ruminiclostridium sp.]
MIDAINDILWGIPLPALILACGITLSFKLKGVQLRKLGLGFKYMFKDDSGGEGEVSGFAALCTALSATVGTGNIVGVAAAVSVGGAGALFWMEIAALFGMATKYAEGLLAVKYRVSDGEGHMLGGPFQYIENGMGKRWKWLAVLFAAFGAGAGLLGIGTITQINGITDAIKGFFDPEMTHTVELFGMSYSIYTVIGGIIITVLAALVLLGGMKRISRVSEIVVPAMTILYVSCCLIVLFTHIADIPAAFAEIFESAFGLRPVSGGLIGISAVAVSARTGISRGIFSNEAGLGSAPIAAASARTKEPVRQGLVSMLGTFIDTIIVCTMTGLVIVISGVHDSGKFGVSVTAAAFEYGLPFPGRTADLILMICLSVFAFTTILGWSCYYERCLQYLFGTSRRKLLIYRCIYTAAIFIGPYMTAEAVWGIADIFNGLMALPNIAALIALSGTVKRETEEYFGKQRKK